MNKIAYLDCPTGIAGDMCLGALVHAGVPLDYLAEKLQRLGLSHEYELRVEAVQRNSQQATKFHVDLTSPFVTELRQVATKNVSPHSSPDPSETEPSTFGRQQHHHHHEGEVHSHSHEDEMARRQAGHRHLPEIERMIQEAGLPPKAEAWSLEVFRTLAEAEGAVHGIPPETVHFHEVGATDAIVDIVGTCLGFDWLGIETLYCSPLPTGGGTVTAAHGKLVVPTPAVMKLWEMRQVPIYNNGIERELCTPTGSAIAVTLAKSFGPPPPMTLRRVGLGAGNRLLPIPNILRLWVGEPTMEEPGSVRELLPTEGGHLTQPSTQETIAVLETQIDDSSPQAIAYLFDLLFAAGAVDVFTQPIVMKKSRLGVLLTAICPPECRSACESAIFRETTTLGIRHFTQLRTILHREIQKVQTHWGDVRVKVAKTGEAITNVQPEYEDCAAIARQYNLSWREVHQIVLQYWHAQKSD